MTALLRYGRDSMLRFEQLAGASLHECQAPRGEPLADLSSAVTDACERPLEFPPLVQALAPGDRVVLAVESDVPQVAEIVDAVIRELVRGGVAPADVTVLYAAGQRDAAKSVSISLAKSGDGVPSVAVHDCDDRSNLAYLAATPDGEPVYLNRLLCDADLVLPIGCARLALPQDPPQGNGMLYPAFSDAKAQQRVRIGEGSGALFTGTVGSHRPERRGRKKLTTPSPPPDVEWMLGVLCVLQVVPGPGDSVLAVIAGTPTAAASRARRLCEQAWSFTLPGKVNLVVAAIEGGAAQQTWTHVARAVAAAAEAVADDSAIAICCDLDTSPGSAMKALAQSEDRQAALRRIRKQHLSDEPIADRFARVMDRVRIFLLSRLDEAVVEELGLAPVASGEEIIRLAGRHKSCLLLANAQRAVVTIEEE